MRAKICWTLVITVIFCGQLASCNTNKKKEGGLRNKHIVVNGEYWSPMLTFDYTEDGNKTNYGGIMYDLLLFMQRARGFTFDIISDADYTWGLCYEPYELRFNETYWECDGMIGMVNRSEIDIALGEYHKMTIQRFS